MHRAGEKRRLVGIPLVTPPTGSAAHTPSPPPRRALPRRLAQRTQMDREAEAGACDMEVQEERRYAIEAAAVPQHQLATHVHSRLFLRLLKANRGGNSLLL
eukprot:SAG11_NODE_582_length_8353_cov_28.953356_5_plen_101_part_00